MKTVVKEVTRTITTTESVNIITIEDFTDFLEERKMLGKFIQYCQDKPIIKNFSNYRTNPFIATQYQLKEWCEFLRDHIEEFCAFSHKDNKWWEFIIRASFRWVSISEDGSSYDTWHDLNIEWLEWLQKNDVIDFEI